MSQTHAAAVQEQGQLRAVRTAAARPSAHATGPSPRAAGHELDRVTRQRSFSGPGQPIDPARRSRAEDVTGIDLSGVRFHTGPAVRVAARAAGASAFTMGGDIAIAVGPDEAVPERLLTHELVHAAQQQTPGAATPAQAESQARAVDSGAGAGVLLGTGGGYIAYAATDWLDAPLGALDFRGFGDFELLDELNGVEEWLSRQIINSPGVDRMQSARSALEAEISRRQGAMAAQDRPRRRRGRPQSPAELPVQTEMATLDRRNPENYATYSDYTHANANSRYLSAIQLRERWNETHPSDPVPAPRSTRQSVDPDLSGHETVERTISVQWEPDINPAGNPMPIGTDVVTNRETRRLRSYTGLQVTLTISETARIDARGGISVVSYRGTYEVSNVAGPGGRPFVNTMRFSGERPLEDADEALAGRIRWVARYKLENPEGKSIVQERTEAHNHGIAIGAGVVTTVLTGGTSAVVAIGAGVGVGGALEFAEGILEPEDATIDLLTEERAGPVNNFDEELQSVQRRAYSNHR